MNEFPKPKDWQLLSPSAPPVAGVTETHLLDEAPVVDTTSCSPPYARAPLEDRSKYEKLMHDIADISSDDSDEEGGRRKRCARATSAGSKAADQTAYLSDDSIGSASDLRANALDDCVRSRRKVSRAATPEQESLNTCGSSAYHAECESATTQDEDADVSCKRRRHERTKDTAGGEQTVPAENDLLVGHQYGEKPLLADDELDSSDGEMSGKSRSSTPPTEHRHDDVFAMAPFPALGSRRSSKQSLPRPGTPPAYSETSVVEEGALVDLGDLDEVLPTHTTSTPRKECGAEEDLFGSSPFNSSNILCENPFKKVVPDVNSAEQRVPRVISSPPHRYDATTLFSQRNSLGSMNSISSQHDLFDSIPFTELGCVTSVPSSVNLSQPSTPDQVIPPWPPVHRTCHSLDNDTVSISKPATPLLPHPVSAAPVLAPVTAAASINPVIPTAVTPPGQLGPPGPPGARTSTSSHRKEEKEGKYHLIEETRSPEKVNILASKVIHKSKASSSSSHKKSKTKKTAVERDAGFSNLSFVDFPSDEAEEPPRDVNKFEVVRGRTRAGKWLP